MDGGGDDCGDECDCDVSGGLPDGPSDNVIRYSCCIAGSGDLGYINNVL